MATYSSQRSPRSSVEAIYRTIARSKFSLKRRASGYFHPGPCWPTPLQPTESSLLLLGPSVASQVGAATCSALNHVCGKTRSAAIHSIQTPSSAAGFPLGFVAYAQKLLGFQSSRHHSIKAPRRLGVLL